MARTRLVFRHGDTLTRVIDWDASDGSAVDLTGYQVLCTISVGSVIFNLTEDDGITVNDAQGRITLELTSDETEQFDAPFGTWQLVVVSASGVTTTLAEGLVYGSGWEDYAS